MHRLCAAALLLSCVVGPARADDVLVLKDGRKIAVTRLARRGGQVVFQTTKGEVFSVPEGQVVSPPLATIPASAPSATAAQPEEPPVLILVLKDGRKIPVAHLARREGLVLFQTTKGESFSIGEDQVLSPPLESMPSLEPAAPLAAPPAALPAPAPVPPETETETRPVPAAPAPEAEFVPMPDRWSIPFPEDPRIVKGRLVDPYNQNVLKGDRPVLGNSVFLVLTGTIDAPSEARRLPVNGGASTGDSGQGEFVGRGNQLFTSPRALVSAELFQGQTAFRPKTWAIKVTSAFNLNYVRVREESPASVQAHEDRSRRRQDLSLEEAFGEVKLATLSRHYDFISARVGIQPFVSDFRGLIFSDSNLGARLFGNLAGNRLQYNAAGFDLLEKDTNSQLNTFEKRGQKVAIANAFLQDFLILGYTISGSLHWSRDEPRVHSDTNGLLTRPAPVGLPVPHRVTSKYAGIAGDGHVGRLNLSHAFYWAFGEDDFNGVAGQRVQVRAQLGALEGSIDKDWLRLKASFLRASGDDKPLDERASGFDTIYDSANFAGGPFSFWSRSAIALPRTKVLLKGPNSLLPSLRSNKFEGQANFVNPGLLLLGAGIDLALTPKLKSIVNANYLRFDKTEPLEALLFQSVIDKPIGLDWGAGVLYRPLLSENVVITAGVTGLLPGKGFDQIFSSSICGVSGCAASGRKLFNTFVQVKLTY